MRHKMILKVQLCLIIFKNYKIKACGLFNKLCKSEKAQIDLSDPAASKPVKKVLKIIPTA